MKIICESCKKVLGEQKPFSDSSEIKAKCTACITKEKEEPSRFTPKPQPGQKQEITLKNGLKGILWVAEKKEEKLFLGELVVSGRKFFCVKNGRVEFQKYLGSLTGEEADVTVLHSISFTIDAPPKGRRKKQDPPKPEEPKKDESIQYNCTIRAPKHYVQLMFDDMAERMDKVTEILADAALRAYEKECQSLAEKGDLSPMSGSKEADNHISQLLKELENF